MALPMRLAVLIAALVAACAATAGVAMAAGTAESQPAPGTEKFSDQAVGRSIDRAVDVLWRVQEDDGNWPVGAGSDASAKPGITALVVYALLESGADPQEPRMKKALDWLAKQKTDSTYVLSLRANVWLAVDKTGAKYKKELEADVRALLTGIMPNGSYTYTVPYRPPPDGRGGLPIMVSPTAEGDNSNAQYAVLGVWAGARANVEFIPREFWAKVQQHWLQCQNTDGGWGYTKNYRNKSYPAMTVAGLATSFVCMDNLSFEQYVQCSAPAEPRHIKAGLDWMEKNFVGSLKVKQKDPRSDAEADAEGATNYYLFGVERVGLASGYKYFGEQDWYKIIATRLTERQRADGSWAGSMWDGGDIGATAYAMLFLVRGRHAVLFNKLQYDGDWNNRPRNLAFLTAWLSRIFENTVNWQIINLKAPVREWHDAPILFISGGRAPKFSEDDIDKLRTFVQQGGTIFSCAECNGDAFKKGIRQAYAKMFPKYELAACPLEDRIYSLHYQLGGKPQLYVVSNGVRPLAIHCDDDLSLQWLTQKEATQRKAYEVAANIYMAVTDKTSLQHRGVNRWPEAVRHEGAPTINVVLLDHGGNSNPEPLALTRFARMMAQEYRVNVETWGPIDIAKLPSSGAAVAVMTGTGEFMLNDPQKEVLKKWIDRGGTLLLDCAGGSKKFYGSAEQLITDLCGEGLGTLASTSDLYQLKGLEITHAKYRRLAFERLRGEKRPVLKAMVVKDRPAVLLSREDITSGLLGTTAYTIDGYEPQTAFAIMRNIVVYAEIQRRAATGQAPLVTATHPVPSTQETPISIKTGATPPPTTAPGDTAD
ncbi:MAG: DUF4159 domain-containing protein [Phycisphaerae bacterium]